MAKPIRLDERGYRQFGMRDKLAYGAGDFAQRRTEKNR